MIAALRRFWFEPVRTNWALVWRVGFGLTLFVAWSQYAVYLERLFGPSGLGGMHTVARAPEVGGLFDLSFPFGVLQWTDEPIGIWLVWVLLLVTSLAFAAGLRARATGAIALLLHVLLVTRMPFAHWGWASMVVPFMAYTILAQSRASTVAGWAPAWPKRLLQLNVCTMYAITGWARVDQPGWLGSSMVHDALTNLMFSRIDADWDSWIPWLAIANWATYVLEPIAPVILWLPTLGTWCAGALIAMHVGLEIVTLVDWWNVVMVLGLTSFLPEDALARVSSGRGSGVERPRKSL